MIARTNQYGRGEFCVAAHLCMSVHAGLALLLWQAPKKDFVHSRHGTSPFAQTQVVANGTTADKGKTEQYDYDFFSIGGGTGGVRAARWSAMNFGRLQC